MYNNNNKKEICTTTKKNETLFPTPPPLSEESFTVTGLHAGLDLNSGHTDTDQLI